MPTVQKVTEGCILGGGPHWNHSSESLYFVDKFGKSILKYTPSTKKFTKATLDRAPAFIIPIENKKNEFIISLENELAVISWDGESSNVTILETLCVLPSSTEEQTTFNDAKCDSFGRLWIGAHHLASDVLKTQPLGTLYSLEGSQELKSHVDKIRYSNGLAFNDKTKKMFFIDSLEGSVDRFDFDITSGTISNRVVWFTLKNNDVPGFPNGMTIDSDGNLWVAVFGGSRIIKIDGSKEETLLDTIYIPDEQVTSVAFGGKNFDELYVTTGAVVIEGRKLASNGTTYRVTGINVKGLPF